MRSPLLMLIPAILMAQRSALPPAEAFDRELKRNRLGTWLVLEDEGAAWGAVARAALDEEALVALNLPLRVVSGGKQPDALAAILRERFSWAKGAHWALVDGKGRVLVEEAATPTAAAMATAVERAGIRTRAQELEGFLRRNPDHLEAQVALLRERVIVANRRTSKILGAPMEKPGAAQSTVPEPPRQLDAENDLKIWSPVVQQLDRLFQGAWREAGIDLGLALRTSSAEHSPAMVAVLTRYKGDIEEALRRKPNGWEPWMVWLQASRKCGGWPLAPLLQSLQPLPGTAPGEWPPVMALSEFIRDAKARRDWIAIREVLEARWEDMRSSGDYTWGGDGLWNVIISPLVEALVSLGDVGTAEQLLGEANEVAGWSGLPGRARDLAIRLSRPDLAVRWGALTPKGR
jgi:hypothetical protein